MGRYARLALALVALSCGSHHERDASGPDAQSTLDAQATLDAQSTLDARAPADARPEAGCGADADGDGIADDIEGRSSAIDTDGDDTPDYLDDDSDGDGLPDSAERGPGCFPRSSDEDFTPDFRDPDSDDDGVSDETEVATGTDPTRADTDGDGCADSFDEVCDEDPIFVELERFTDQVERFTLTLPAAASEARLRVVSRGGHAPFPTEHIVGTTPVGPATPDGEGFLAPEAGPLDFDVLFRVEREGGTERHVGTAELVADGVVVSTRPVVLHIRDFVVLI